ncbi:hypothetical protein HI914_04212 [Erysiphe necator]|nr:hypothetical protein HI914_04212 [Erysiphe necator]
MAATYYQDNSVRSLNIDHDDLEPLEWDPSFLDISSTDESPEPVTINSQPVTYTTVGSLVDPKAILQFATPSRIQREGANRKPLMSLLANRPFDSVFQSFEFTPPKPSYSIRYTQKSSLAPSDNDQNLSLNLELNSNSKNLPSSIESPRDLLKATQHEENCIIEKNGLLPICSESKAVKNQLLSLDSESNSTRDTISKDLGGKANGPMKHLSSGHQVLEKMQTLQRLSRFNNPIQEWAQNKLSEFAVNKKQIYQKNSPSSASSHDSLLYSCGQAHENQAKYPELEDLRYRIGHLDIDNVLHKFPKQLRANRNQTQSNVVSTRSLSYPHNYPQPLTAGPPGQRQSSLNFSQSCSSLNQQPRHFRAMSFESLPRDQMNNFRVRRIPYQHKHILPWAGHTSSDLVDTLTTADAAKYYPFAWPSGSLEIRTVNNPMCFAIQKPQIKNIDNSNDYEWFYSGQRRYASMVSQCERINGDKGINQNDIQRSLSQLKTSQAEFSRLSIINFNGKSLSECVAPMINILFLNLLEYSERRSPGSRTALSNYIESSILSFDSSNHQ